MTTGNLITKTIQLGRARNAVEAKMIALATVVPSPALSAEWTRINQERQDTIQKYLAAGGELTTIQGAIRMHHQDQ